MAEKHNRRKNPLAKVGSYLSVASELYASEDVFSYIDIVRPWAIAS